MDNQQIILPNDAKQIPNFSKYYITPRAEVFSTARGKLRQLKFPYDKSCGYRRGTMIDDNAQDRYMLLHRLVALTFLPETFSEEKEVNHKDANKLNNDLSNLEWVTRSENLKHAYSYNLLNVTGESNPRALLTEKDVLDIYNRLVSGEKNSVLAKEYGVGRSTIINIKERSAWYYLTKDLPEIPMNFKSKTLEYSIVIEICKLFEQGKTAKQVFDLYELGATLDQLSDIKRRKCFAKISKDFVW